MLHRKLAPVRLLWLWIARILFGTASAVNIIAASLGSLKVKPTEGLIHFTLRSFAEDHCWWIILAATSIIAVTSGFLRLAGAPKATKMVQDMLDELQGAIFSGKGYEVPTDHKVTLFKVSSYSCLEGRFWRICHQFGRKPRWLVPVARSGHMNQNTRTAFRVTDDGRTCEGLAGQAWARQKMMEVCALPNMRGNPYQHLIDLYAARTFVTKEVVKEKKAGACALLAVPLLVRGEHWGVLVFDSTNPAQISRDGADRVIKLGAGYFANVIERYL